MSINDQIEWLKSELGPEDPMSKLARSDFEHYDKKLNSAVDGRLDLGLTKHLIEEYNWDPSEAALAVHEMTPLEVEKLSNRKKFKKPKVITRKELDDDSISGIQEDSSITPELEISGSPIFIPHPKTIILFVCFGLVILLCPFALAQRRSDQQANEQVTSRLLDGNEDEL